MSDTDDLVDPVEVEEEVEEVQDVSDPKVLTKYRTAGDICNAALKHVAAQCVAGAKVVEICDSGDNYITEATSKIYNKGKVEKGIGFPTCLSINNVVGHFSPLGNDETTLAAGDMVKIDLGVHVDGYVAVGAHTIKVGDQPITGTAANAVAAAYTAVEIAVRLLKAGKKNADVSAAIEKVASEFKVNAVAGVLSHQLERFVIDGEKIIMNKIDPEQKVEECEFEPNEVYAIDIVMTTGEGKPRESTERTTVYKRAVDETYHLKLQASRSVFSTIQKKHPNFPFTIRNDFDEKKVRFGIVECYKHDLVHAYPILLEKEGEVVAHCKVTAAILANGTVKISGLPMPVCEPSESLQDKELVALMATSLGKKKKKNNKKKKKAAPAGN
jgi:curved DNA binding protein